jgi:hypothetical protein
VQSIGGGVELIAEAAPSESPLESAPATPQPANERFEFTGKAGEYFGIWVVNLFLSIVTLGIHSAWKKVRRKRYSTATLLRRDFRVCGKLVAIPKGGWRSQRATRSRASSRLSSRRHRSRSCAGAWFPVRLRVNGELSTATRSISAGYRDGCARSPRFSPSSGSHA